MKASKYIFYTQDEDGNLIIYNFMNGLNSLTKIKKESVNYFKDIFLSNEKIDSGVVEKYPEIVDKLLQLGILVPADVDETVTNEVIHYEKALDGKLHLTVLPTGRCMFRCPYCYEESQQFHRNSMTEEGKKALV